MGNAYFSFSLPCRNAGKHRVYLSLVSFCLARYAINISSKQVHPLSCDGLHRITNTPNPYRSYVLERINHLCQSLRGFMNRSLVPIAACDRENFAMVQSLVKQRPQARSLSGVWSFTVAFPEEGLLLRSGTPLQ
jgi:hypothetical protein